MGLARWRGPTDNEGKIVRLVSFERAGRSGYGGIVDGGIVDLTGAAWPDLKAVLEAGALDLLATELARRTADFAVGDVVLLPVIPQPGKIWCCGLNYGEHVQETRNLLTNLVGTRGGSCPVLNQ